MVSVCSAKVLAPRKTSLVSRSGMLHRLILGAFTPLVVTGRS